MWRRLTQFMYHPDEPAGGPAPTPPEGGTQTEVEPTPSGTPTEDYQKRYEDLRPQYDRTQSELNTLRQQEQARATDRDALREYLAGLGIDLEEEAAPPVEEPTTIEELRQQLRDELMAEIEPVRQTQQQAAAQREFEAAENHANKVFSDVGKARGWELDTAEQEAVIGRALTMPADPNGMPPFKEAYDALEAIWVAREARAAKNRRPTHQFTPSGVAGDDKPDITTHAGRVANAMAKLADTA